MKKASFCLQNTEKEMKTIKEIKPKNNFDTFGNNVTQSLSQQAATECIRYTSKTHCSTLSSVC